MKRTQTMNTRTSFKKHTKHTISTHPLIHIIQLADGHRNICPDCYVLDNCVSYSQLTGDVDQAAWLLLPMTLLLVLLPMLIDCCNNYMCAGSLDIAASNYGTTIVDIYRSLIDL
jgi:hypothetical protein